MLAEGFVALIALVTVMVVTPESIKGLKPGTIYGNGIGNFLTIIIGKENLPFAITFGAMAFSTFVFDTLDVSTRLGRYTLQELFGWTGTVGAIAATALTLLLPVAFVMAADEGAYRTFWTLFGTSNQLLAALTFLAVSVWLRRSGRAYWFTLAPMVFVMSITLYSLAIQAATAVTTLRSAGASVGTATLNGGVALVLIALAAFLVFEGARALLEPVTQRNGNETWQKS
jgi:carbon starvation protein